jgi:hypothetical protein
MKYLILLTIGSLMIGCAPKSPDAQQIIDQAIAVSGGEKYLSSTIAFDFRERHYVGKRNGGTYSYERITQDSSQTIHDYVTNSGFRREVDGEFVTVPDSLASRYSASVNSVLYFALLPYGLNDPSVKKEYLGETELEGEKYHKLQITFQAEGGGEDFEDVYHYWIHPTTFTIGYLAYSFQENDETSFRFRKAYNPRQVNGITFLDYINYKPEHPSTSLAEAENLFKEDQLQQLSVIELKNITVQ